MVNTFADEYPFIWSSDRTTIALILTNVSVPAVTMIPVLPADSSGISSGFENWILKKKKKQIVIFLFIELNWN